MSTILDCIRTVGKGERGRKPLNFEQAYQVMDEYLDGKIGDDQMAMLMMLIRVQNETHDEIAGFVKAFQTRMPDIGADIDWPCYAGKRASAGKPWHIIAAKILAENGYKVLVHGHLEETSIREHVRDYIDALDIPFAADVKQAKEMIEHHNIVYLPLTSFAPQVVTMLDWKNRYGLRTPINTVVRALNPGNARYGIRGSFHPGFQQLHAEVEQAVGLSKHAVISFKGQSGESEYNPKVSQTVWRSDNNGVTSHYWPETMASDLPQPKQPLLGTDPSDYNMMANTVVATLCAVLFAKVNDRDKAYELAYALWSDWVVNSPYSNGTR
ncbi:glycosyl transferase family protein [Vibrio sp. DW001]|uniref:glycosyl transferase family protein n=1 Tax=Vibrio sp. DW001 TaxID=2912315 RepID=UPI0023AF343A|nr:glycosyl transferase family protein [Vibrio sp. DW001]WED27796.1 glycosyl transferase family protein [Vibrio sp. DW001]